MENFEEESMAYLAGGLSATEESAFEEFLRENQDYQSRFEEVKSSWVLLSALDSPEPSEAMDDGFIKMLDTAERKQAKKREPSLWHTWRQIFTPSLAFGTLLLLLGLGVGYWFSPKENSIPQNNAVVVEGETEAVRQKLVLTLLEQPSANQRLDGVNEANKIMNDSRNTFFFFKQKTAYEIVSRDWSSDVCSSDLVQSPLHHRKADSIQRQ